MILILTEEFDPHADVVISALTDRSIDVVRFDPVGFPTKSSATIRFNTEADGEILNVNGSRVDLGKIHAIWNRRPKASFFPKEMDQQYQKFAEAESSQIMRGLWHLLRDQFWVNAYEPARAAEQKPYQLRMAQKVGLDIPRTIMTNEPAEALDFFDKCGCGVIYKPFAYHYQPNEGGGYSGIYTNIISRNDLKSRADQIRIAPCTFQEYVPKHVEIRATVIGNEIFAAEIHSQNSERSKHDWRKYDIANTPYLKHTLPGAVKSKVLTLLKDLGLVFACFDFILTADGKYVFLELNQSGQWYWVQLLTGLPILEYFVELLIHKECPCSLLA